MESTPSPARVQQNNPRHNQRDLVIFKSNSVCELVKLLSSTEESALFHAVTSLHSLMLQLEKSTRIVRMAGGLHKMIPLLQGNNEKLLTVVVECIHMLSYEHQESKLIIFARGAPTELLRIMRSYTDKKLLLATVRVLEVLSVCSQNKLAIVEAGGMEILGMQLSHKNKKIVLNCLYTLRNLSDAATEQYNLDGLLRSLVKLLDSLYSCVVNCVVGILSNLTCSNNRNKVIICQVGGIKDLVRTAVVFGDTHEITELTIITLQHLTIGHPRAEMAQNEVRLHNGLKVLVKLLHPDKTKWSIMKVVIGLIGNLALSTANLAPLRHHGAIQRLVYLLRKAYLATQQQRSGVLFNNNPIAYDHGVRMEEIVQGTVGALNILARDRRNRAFIRHLSIIPVLIKLLCKETGDVQKFAGNLLCELAEEREGVEMIEKEGVTLDLIDLLGSSNRAVFTYTADILFKLLLNF